MLAGALLAAAAPLSVLAQGTADAALLEQLKAVEADPARLDAALRQGAKLSAFCANCHGSNGNSTHDETPNLAGQNTHYLLVQMQKFATGQRRYEFMQGLINAMSASERISMVLFYARQPVTTRQPKDAALVKKGKDYYMRVCMRCHGADGKGSQTYARLAGQQTPYVTLALTRYRDRTGERIDPLMADSTKLLTDQDIQAVAAYVSSMR